MTKKEWKNIRVGTKVQLPVFKSQGEIKRINSNCSQVFVLWESGLELPYGRLGLELVQV